MHQAKVYKTMFSSINRHNWGIDRIFPFYIKPSEINSKTRLYKGRKLNRITI